MIVEIKEYSFRTGEGIAVSPKGELTTFTYKQFKDQRSIPIGKKASLRGRELSPVGIIKSLWFYIYKISLYKLGGK